MFSSGKVGLRQTVVFCVYSPSNSHADICVRYMYSTHSLRSVFSGFLREPRRYSRALINMETHMRILINGTEVSSQPLQ
ncbi:hypothetical protein Y032_0726g1870 [Ancylostoma ceylanicum]|uniref:Uncharacterized protein n=1 Tax=Ancylostoma ceylanicum TaxID=53326 RepID=A0A016WF89_9BILA|nr:hypothetical protein Y032_0726g1870 [Ancylostoma ceylanicum]